jgi:hypothetical protein
MTLMIFSSLMTWQYLRLSKVETRKRAIKKGRE